MKTHQIHTNIASCWVDDSQENALSQIAITVKSLGDGDYDFISINRVPPDTKYDEFPYVHDWMQAISEKDRFVVEFKRLEADGLYHLYVVGRAAPATESVQMEFGTRAVPVYAEEILGFNQALELFTHHYMYNTVPDGWNLRPREEYIHE